MLHFIHKNVSRVFSVKCDSPICRSQDYKSSNWHVTWQAGANGEWLLSWHRYRDIIISWRHIFCLHQDGRFTKISHAWSAKIHPTFAIKYFWRPLADVCMVGEVLRVVPRCRVLVYSKYPSVALNVPSRHTAVRYCPLSLTPIYFKDPWLRGTTVGLP